MADLTLSKSKRPAVIASIIIIAIILGLVIAGFIFRSPKKQKPIQTKPSAVPFSSGAKLPQPTGFENEVNKIKSELPHQTQKYVIEYVSPINIINVKISATSKEDYLKTKLEAENYLKSKSITDLCKLSIFWIAPKDAAIRKSMTPKDLTTSGCPIN